MTILVTGASGFVGLNILRHLSAAYPMTPVVAADRTAPDAADLVLLGPARGRTHRVLDVTDFEACGALIDDVKPSHILHAAALTLTDEGSEAADLIRSVNLDGTIHVLDAAIDVGGVRRCVILSSGGVYGPALGPGICDEDHPLDPRNDYARTKRAAEAAMAARVALGALDVVAARVGPVYGPFERRRTTRPRLSLIRQLLDYLEEGRPLRISGPNVSRDWTHAADIARGLTGLLYAPHLNHPIYNLSTGHAVSALEILGAFVAHGLQARWVGPDDEADLRLTPADGRKSLAIGRIQRDTGFVAQFDFPTGLADVASTNGRPSRHSIND